MKTKNGIFLLFASIFFLSVSCKQTAKDKTPTGQADSVKVEQQAGNTEKGNDYSGRYKTDDTKGCSFLIELKKDGKSYRFSFKGEGIDNTGRAFIDPIDGKNYVSFDGRIGSNEAGTISGEVNNEAIIIQNYGNSINEYHFFKMCDSKFLEFKKQ